MADCAIPGCGKPACGRGLCASHYGKQRRHGDPLVSKRSYYRGKTPDERFWLYTQKGPDCWEWLASKVPAGYGVLHPTPSGPYALAHRFSYELHNGPIPAGKHILHRCDNPGCVNPDHLMLGTPADNMADMIAKGRARHPPLRGTQNGSAKLDEASVRAIRASKDVARVAADKFGVSKNLVDAIRQRRLWSHIE